MIYKRYRHPVIELCNKCKGTGVDYTYHEYDILLMEPTEVICSIYEGSGRVFISKKIEVTVEPFKIK
jgi:hypothetical protein